MGLTLVILAAIVTLGLVVDRVLGHVYWPDRGTAVRDFREQNQALKNACTTPTSTTTERARPFEQIKKSRRV